MIMDVVQNVLLVPLETVSVFYSIRLKRGYGIKCTPRAFLSQIGVLRIWLKRGYGLQRHEE